jgi:hypothetical protein
MPEDCDDDIAAMDLSPEEKNGIQVYRNYTKVFIEAREKKFAEAGTDSQPVPTAAY